MNQVNQRHVEMNLRKLSELKGPQYKLEKASITLYKGMLAFV